MRISREAKLNYRWRFSHTNEPLKGRNTFLTVSQINFHPEESHGAAFVASALNILAEIFENGKRETNLLQRSMNNFEKWVGIIELNVNTHK